MHTVGTPCDLVNVRLQNDMKLPAELRRNYKHVFDGVYQIARYEGKSYVFQLIFFSPKKR